MKRRLSCFFSLVMCWVGLGMFASAQSVETRDATIAGSQLHYLEAGDRSSTTVLLLHGARFSSKTWLDVGTIAQIANAGHHVVALDLPGFGKSEQSSVPRDEYLNRALNELLPGNAVVIVSPSMSGGFSLPFVARHADRVAGFVPVAPVAISTYRGELRSVTVPTLVVWGENDAVVPVAQADVLASAFGGRKLILEGASHPCYLDRPEEFHRELLKFLEGL